MASKGVSADVASKPPTSCNARFSKVRAEVQRGLILLVLELPPDPSERGCARADLGGCLTPHLWTEKSKLASMLVFWSPRGPRVPMAWGGCVGAAGYPMGCQIGRLTRHETPLARPSQATKISKPNRFAYPFRSRPRGVRGAPILNLRPHQAPSYRDTSTANLGLGVTPRRGLAVRSPVPCLAGE